MRSLKESIGIAVSQGRTDPRIAALARAGKLGIILWHWKYAKEDRVIEAQNLLTRRAAKRLRMRSIGEGVYDYELLRTACRQALEEWYSPECAFCSGVREVIEVHKRVVCDRCEGTGVRAYTDFERCDALKITKSAYQKTWDKRFKLIHSVIVGKDAETLLKVREQLNDDETHIEVEEELDTV